MNVGEKHCFRYCGQDIKIHPLAKIVRPEVIDIDDFSVIDDFTFINGGAGIQIGKHVHIASFTSIVGGGKLVIGDYATIGHGTKIITAKETFLNEMMAPVDLLEETSPATRDKVIIEKGVVIGNDVVIHPNVRISEGAVIDNHSQVLADVYL
ncbi:MAG: hypothetical protein A2144_01385 [Chloroflexi bacterium RBG_16_50_9]|nr:MAG: hypothetical protein A2144_01385 [Chloroflexi bacterium RBG_16_50_9]